MFSTVFQLRESGVDASFLSIFGQAEIRDNEKADRLA